MKKFVRFFTILLSVWIFMGLKCNVCECENRTINLRAIDRGTKLEVECCLPGEETRTDTFTEPKRELYVERCGHALPAPEVEDVKTCLSSGCRNVLMLSEGLPIQLYSEGDTLPDDGFYLKVVRIDTSVYLIGLNRGDWRVHLSPTLHDGLAPDTGDYADTVITTIPADSTYGHAIWMDRGSPDIDTIPYAPGDFFGKVRVMEVWGDSVRLKVGYRFKVPGLRWIKGG